MNADHSADGAGEDKDSGAALVERVRALVPAFSRVLSPAWPGDQLTADTHVARLGKLERIAQ